MWLLHTMHAHGEYHYRAGHVLRQNAAYLHTAGRVHCHTTQGHWK